VLAGKKRMGAERAEGNGYFVFRYLIYLFVFIYLFLFFFFLFPSKYAREVM